MAEEEQVQNLSIKERIQNWNQLSKSTSDLSLSNEASNKSTSKETSEISPSTTTTTKVDEEVKTNESKPKKEETNVNEQTFAEFSQEHHITKLPDRKQQEIRLFLSSTFDDQGAERTLFQKDVFPRLKKYCADKGWGFQVVDLRWGIRDESTDDHRTVEICMGEIERCQEISPDCYFVVLLGNRYGWRPPPAKIPEKDWDKIIKIAEANNTATLLKEWYKCDRNSKPPIYKLSPLNDKNRGQFWKTDMVAITKSIHDAVKELYAQGNLTEERYKTYTVSVTEQEVINGLFHAPGAEKNSLAFLRDIEGYNHTDPNGFRYANCVKQADGSYVLDQESWDLQQKLKEKVIETLPKENVFQYKAKWTGEGMSTDHVQQQGKDFYKAIKGLIKKQITSFVPENPLDNEETLQRSTFEGRVDNFVGREHNVKQILDYLNSVTQENDSNPTPLIITSSMGMGAGKTSLLSHCIRQFTTEISKNSSVSPIIITRRIGVSASSNDTHSLAKEILMQIQYQGIKAGLIPDMDVDKIIEKSKNLETFGATREMITPLLPTVASQKTPIIITVSGIDQTAEDGFARLDWLPKELPPYIRIIVSGDDLMKHFPEHSPEFIVNLEPLSDSDGKLILEEMLQQHRRTLSLEQRLVVLEKFSKYRSPLYLKYLVDISLTWRSDSTANTLPDDISGCLEADFSGVEKYHGYILTSRAMMFIALSKEGLSEEELITILSSDEEVLSDVLQYHKPDPRKLPAIVWSRLYQDVGHYLRQKNAFRTTLLTFNHPIVKNYVLSRYQGPEIVSECFGLSSQYFYEQPLLMQVVEEKDEEEEEEEKETIDQTENPEETQNSESNQETEEAPAHQPRTIVNYRKPSELLHHLIGANRWDEIQQLICDLTYIETRCYYYGLHTIQADIRLALTEGKKRGITLDDIHELVILLQPDPLPNAPPMHVTPPKRWGMIQSPPWRVVPPFQGDLTRHRGTRAIHFEVGQGWFFFNQRFQAHQFPLVPHLWSTKMAGSRYMDPPPSFPGKPAPQVPAHQQNAASKPFNAPLPQIIQKLKTLRIGQSLSFLLYRS